LKSNTINNPGHRLACTGVVQECTGTVQETPFEKPLSEGVKAEKTEKDVQDVQEVREMPYPYTCCKVRGKKRKKGEKEKRVRQIREYGKTCTSCTSCTRVTRNSGNKTMRTKHNTLKKLHGHCLRDITCRRCGRMICRWCVENSGLCSICDSIIRRKGMQDICL